jgi:cytochrome c553
MRHATCVAVVAALAAPAAPAAQGRIDFARDVQGILAKACVRCHIGPAAEQELRLDTREGLLAGSSAGRVVIPGDASASPLYQRLVTTETTRRMPWLEDPLPPSDIETLRRWIDEGASWPGGLVVRDAAPPPTSPVPRQSAPATRSAAAQRVQFNRDVRPILADNCFACHGPDRNRRQAGLRLDREDAAKAALASGSSAVVPGDPDASALIRRVTHPDEEQRMPQIASGKARLSAAQIETLRRWIAEGAEWQVHWAYLPAARPTAPAVRDESWPRNPVDRFVLAALERKGVSPSPSADRSELLRRLSFDLVGLPPSAEETSRFLADTRQDAYERQIDRLLASPRYGERMASYWLDLVRYADSVGYHSDNARTVWRYRDYVIKAFNENMPFDRFTREQLAGDLLPDATDEQKVASGYNRLLQTTEEGGAQPKEYRAIYLADRVRNASTVWLGSTLGCAQCHDHKFDPFLARDFYSFAAFFADVQEKPVGRRDPNYLPDETRRPQLEALDREIKSLQKLLGESTPELEREQEVWEKTLAGARVHSWTALEPVSASAKNGTRVLIQGNDFSIIAAGPGAPKDTYTARYKTPLKNITALRLEAVTFEELPRRGPGRAANGGFAVTELSVFDEAGRRIKLRNASASTAEGSSPGAAIDGKDGGRAWSLAAADGDSYRLVAETAQPIGSGEETALTVVIHQNKGDGRTLGRFRMSASADAPPVRTQPGREITKEIRAIAARPHEERTKEQSETIARFYRSVAPSLAAARDRLRAAELERDALVKDVPQSLVTAVQKPDIVRVLPRGNWLDDGGEIVSPGVPHFLPALRTSGTATRLDLARWLTSRENPLTARVAVNRLWKLFFGQGLVRTLEDLGSQGEWPTHPELLDWLAVEFMDWGWDVKHVVRTLVTSQTYRQTARASAELLQRDPYNRLYARQSRQRLDAEAVRDNALAVAGLLSPKIGGPSVHPYQPSGYWSYLNFPPREWDDSSGEDQYRRGLYTHWQRTFLHPSLLAFDAPTREECVAERTRSNTPQQALALLNDPTYVEAARVFAARILRDGGKSFDERLRWAYAQALSRAPSGAESRVLAELLRKHERHYRQDSGAARRLLATGQAAPARKPDEAQLAAWTSLARAILNLPELITRP